MTKTKRLLSLFMVGLLGTTSMKAQFTGTSYLSVGAGVAIPHSSSKILSPEPMLSLSYGYLLSDKLTIDAPLVYQGLASASLKGMSISTLPTLYYGISKGDKHRLEVGGTLGVGFEKYQKPTDPLIVVKGSLESVNLYVGVGARYTLLLSSKVGIYAMYKYLYQPQSIESMAQTFSGGVLFYL